MPRRILTADDIIAAAAWRLAGWPQEWIEAGRATVADLLAHGTTFDEGEPEVARALALIADDGRDPWSALCALTALQADQAGDVALLYSAGLEVLEARRQALRAGNGHRPDSLDVLIAAHIAELPDIAPAALWASIVSQAGIAECLGDFDCETSVLSYTPHPGDELVDINFIAFRRRVQRARKKFQTSPRQNRLPSHRHAYDDFDQQSRIAATG